MNDSCVKYGETDDEEEEEEEVSLNQTRSMKSRVLIPVKREKVDFSDVIHQAKRYEVLLEPFMCKKLVLASLLHLYHEVIACEEERGIKRSVSRRMLFTIQSKNCKQRKRNFFRIRFLLSSSFFLSFLHKLSLYRWSVLFQINKKIQFEFSGFWLLEKYLRSLTFVSAKTVKSLRSYQRNLSIAQKKGAEIESYIVKCESIKSCKALQHEQLNGCPICSVRYLGTVIYYILFYIYCIGLWINGYL